jgi:hypothetical protein
MLIIQEIKEDPYGAMLGFYELAPRRLALHRSVEPFGVPILLGLESAC